MDNVSSTGQAGFLGFVSENALIISLALGGISLALLALSVILVVRNNVVSDGVLRRGSHHQRRLVK